MTTMLVTSSIRASDPALIWIVECVRRVVNEKS